MDARLDYNSSEILQKFGKHINSAAGRLAGTALPPAIQNLVLIRASQINGCAVCLDMHTKDAAHAGETSLRLNLVAAWRDAKVFTDAERAALEITEQGTRIADAAGGVSDEAWANAAKHYDPDQLGALVCHHRPDQRVQPAERDQPEPGRRLPAWPVGMTVAVGARPVPGSPGLTMRPMTAEQDGPRVVSASREIAAAPERIFELIADPSQQPRWDGNDNLSEAPGGQRVRRAGDMFRMTLTTGASGRTTWSSSRKPAASPGTRPRSAAASRATCGAGCLSRVGDSAPWSPTPTTGPALTDQNRLPRARSTTPDKLRASLDRLAALAEAALITPSVDHLADRGVMLDGRPG